MGNECGDGENFTTLKKEIKAIDPTRPIHYERAIDGDNTDIYAVMYAPPKSVEEYVANNPKKPYILCEYTHAMGNSNGGIQEYWDLAEKYPSFQGGFIWDFMDQALWKTDEKGKWLAYGGDFGDKPNDDNFNCNGWFDALRNPHPGAYEIKHAYQSIKCTAFDFATGKVKVRNNFLFTTLEDYCCSWQSFNADGTPAAKGMFDCGEVAPGATAEFALENFSGDIVNFKFYGDADCCAWDSFARPFVSKTVPSPSSATGAGKSPALRAVTWREADREIFNALAVEKNMTALLLSLISLVAVFCVMNTLLVLTVQKTPEIGLLKAIGFRRMEIMKVFMVHGMIQCGIGIVLGLLASWAILANLQNIVEWLARMGVEVFPASVYGLSAIPHRLIVSDIFWVVGLVLVFGFLASFVPALCASLKDPVKALNT